MFNFLLAYLYDKYTLIVENIIIITIDVYSIYDSVLSYNYASEKNIFNYYTRSSSTHTIPITITECYSQYTRNEYRFSKPV